MIEFDPQILYRICYFIKLDFFFWSVNKAFILFEFTLFIYGWAVCDIIKLPELFGKVYNCS